MLRNYIDVRNWLETFIPLVYGKEELGLSRIENLLEKIGNPQKKFKSIHVGGTSGKGSTAFYISRLILKKGLKIGLHVSPHLIYIGERMQINGKNISLKRLIALVNEIKPVVDDIKSKQPQLTLSYFEILVAISFLYFAKEKVDWAVVEVGLGGRLDATNVLSPEVSVITNIGLDHTEILGDAIEGIAKEKAGIIKTRVPVVTGAGGKALKVIEKAAKSKNASLIKLNTRTLDINSEIDIFLYKSLYNDILRYRQNKAVLECMFLAILAVLTLKIRINKKVMDKAFSEKFGGRFEQISDCPTSPEGLKGVKVILDGAHNVDKMKALIAFVKNTKYETKSIALVVAFKTGKDWKKMLDILLGKLPIKSVIATEYQAVTDTGRGSAVPADDIAKYLDDRFKMIDVRILKNSQEAVYEAIQAYSSSEQSASRSSIKKKFSTCLAGRQASSNNNLILVTGSLYLVGEARTLWKLPEF